MKFRVFRLFRSHRNAVDDTAITGIIQCILQKKKKKKKKQNRSFGFRSRRQKPHPRQQNEPYDVVLAENVHQIEQNSLGPRNNNSDGDYNKISQQSGQISSVAAIGRPPKRLLRKKERMTFRMHNFSQCTAKRGEYRLTPKLQAHGYNWKLQIYPCGDNHSSVSAEYMSCFLHYFASKNDKQSPVAKVEYCCGTYKTETQICAFAVERGKCSTSWGLKNFMRRDQIIRNCLDEDGALSIDINIQIAVDQKVVWYPPSIRQEPTLIELYRTAEETGDATFRLTTRTPYEDDFAPFHSTKSSFYDFKAHKMILALRAKILFELVSEEMTPFEDEPKYITDVVELPGIDCDTFETMLEHIYTIRQPNIKNEEEARKLLVAADRFCLTNLKLYVESIIVDKFATASTAASLLLFADSHSCALLKEAAMDLYASDPGSVMRTPCWSLLKESETILSELSKHVHTGCRQNFYVCNGNDIQSHGSNREIASNDAKSGRHKNSDNLDRLDVFSIREQLAELGLNVDGSRLALLTRLRSFQKEAKC